MLKMDLEHKQARNECYEKEYKRDQLFFVLGGQKLIKNLFVSFLLMVSLSEEIKTLSTEIDSLRAIGWEQE